jgi:hypothetical protein
MEIGCARDFLQASVGMAKLPQWASTGPLTVGPAGNRRQLHFSPELVHPRCGAFICQAAVYLEAQSPRCF